MSSRDQPTPAATAPGNPRRALFELATDPSLAPPVRAFRGVLLLAQRLRFLMDQRLRPDGLTTQQAAVLTTVARLGQPSLNEAATALGTTHQNLAQIVDALRRKGFVRVEPDPADRRRRRLVTTAAHDRYWGGRDAADHAAVAQWFAALSTEEQRTLGELTGRVLDRLTRDDPDQQRLTPSAQPHRSGETG